MSRGTGEYRARTKVGSYSESENGMIISGKPVDYKFNTSFKNDTANWTLHWSNLTDYQCNQLETTIVYTAVQFTGILYRNNTADCNLPCIGATQRIRVAVYASLFPECAKGWGSPGEVCRSRKENGDVSPNENTGFQ
ncbi:UNVERIFIED_CONTAM: hypothetical protein FKN15_003829 [Acipenser sinensis]